MLAIVAVMRKLLTILKVILRGPNPMANSLTK